MLAKTFSATLIGLKPVRIEIEVDATVGVPNLIMIGLPSKSVEEARERIASALMNCGIKIRAKRTVVNLAPADLKKTGSAFDLAIAVTLMQLYGEIEGDFSETMFFGELALDGVLKPIRGALPLVMAAKEMGFKRIFVPQASEQEIEVVTGIDIYLVEHLQNFIDWCHAKKKLKMVGSGKEKRKTMILGKESDLEKSKTEVVDFQDIKGQLMAKRCLEIAAAGGHNLLMFGPPGSGKSLLAQALVKILPPLTIEEMIEVTTIYSICGLNDGGLVRRRPFRAPHHSISSVGMIGGGQTIRPGEVSLAHRGILFLDEILEFPRGVLESLRLPLEDGKVSVVRAIGRADFPASLTLVAAANPCPCGYSGSAKKPCRCSPGIKEIYRQKLSGPIIDRIDQVLQVSEVPIQDLKGVEKHGESSATVRQRVMVVREKQRQRLKGTPYLTNSEIKFQDIKELCHLTSAAENLLQVAAEKYSFSARTYFKIIKVAQTIADLENEAEIGEEMIAEAVQYRTLESFSE